MSNNLRNQTNTNIFEYIRNKQKESSLDDVVTALISDFIISVQFHGQTITLFNELFLDSTDSYYAFEQYNLIHDIEKDIPDLGTFYVGGFDRFRENILSNLYYGNKQYKSRNYNNIRFLFNLSLNRLYKNCIMLHNFGRILFDCANELLKDENIFMKQTVYDCVREAILNTLIKIQEKEEESN